MSDNKADETVDMGEYEFDEFCCDLWEFAGKWVDDKMASLARRAAVLYEDETACRIVRLHAEAKAAYEAARRTRFDLLTRGGDDAGCNEEYVGMLADKAHQWADVMYELFLAR